MARRSARRGPGARMCEAFYRGAVAPILTDHFPPVRHAAGLIDGGSEVLGFDDDMSTDHHWGPRVLLFVDDADHARWAAAIQDAMGRYLPVEIDGVPTNFSPPDPLDGGVQHLRPIEEGPVNHRVEVHTPRAFFDTYLGIDVSKSLAPEDWLGVSEQRLRTVTEGPIFHDEIGLERIRAVLDYYPRDVWLYQMASVWSRIGQDEHLMGRAGIAGDELGSAVIAARLVRDVMRLAFLIERRYAPYAKWLGTAFRELSMGAVLTPTLSAVMRSQTWDERERHLVDAYETIATAHAALEVGRPMPTTTRAFWGRPFRVIAMHGFAEALVEEIEDPAVRRLTARPLVGGVDLVSDNTDLVDDASWRPWIRSLYASSDPGRAQ